MSGTSATKGNIFIVKVDAASATKEKAILPGYRPDVVRAMKINDNANGDEFIGIAGDDGTGANRAILRDQAGQVTYPAANGFTFRKDGVVFAGNAAAPLGVVGSWLVELIRDGYLGMPTADLSNTAEYVNDGIPAEDALVDFKLRDGYERETRPWMFRAA